MLQEGHASKLRYLLKDQVALFLWAPRYKRWFVWPLLGSALGEMDLDESQADDTSQPRSAVRR
ncbi:MAG: hypothetical protein QW057_02315 [Candidatus Bathyarchaeia archaeon]